MSDEAPAVFQAVYADMKLVKSRSVVQFVFEVPTERGQEAMNILGGMPRFSESVWVAIARLSQDSDGEKAPAQESTQLDDVPKQKKPSNVAALACDDIIFQRWLHRMYEKALDPSLSAAAAREQTATLMRKALMIDSRADLDKDPEALARWGELQAMFKRDTAPFKRK